MNGRLNSRERAQWFLHQVAGKSGIGNLGISCRFGHRLGWWAAQESLRLLAVRHPALRQTFLPGDGMPVRRVIPEGEASVPLEVTSAAEAELDSLLSMLVAQEFDLARGPLFRAAHVMVGGESVLLLVAHHIVADGVSMGILLTEFAQLYEYLANGAVPPSDLVSVVPSYSASAPDQAAISRWGERLAQAATEGMRLDSARQLAGSPRFSAALTSVPLSGQLRYRLAELRKLLKVSDGILTLALSAALLHRHGADGSLVLGVPVDLRRGAAVGSAVGFHVSTVPVPFNISAATSFSELVEQSRAAMLEALSGPPVSFEDVLEQFGYRTDDWRTPLFRHVVNVQPLSAPVLRGVTDVRAHRAGCRTDLELMTGATPDGLALQAWLSTEVHDCGEIVALLRRFAPLAESACADPDTAVADLRISSPGDDALLTAVNATSTALPDATLADLVALTWQSTPDRCAIVSGGERWTFGRLHRTAARVAGRLRDLGVTPGDRVGVVGHRGPRLAAAVLGIWSRGAAYVPVDPDLPRARAAAVLDGAAGIVVPDPPWTVLEAGRDIPFVLPVAVDDDGEPPFGLTMDARPDGLAVVVSTSGTTGQPKRVMVSHRAMVNVVLDFVARLNVSAGDRVLWSTTFSFDVSALELFMPLVRGATVVVADDDTRRRPVSLLALIAGERVGIVQATPTLWRELAPAADRELAQMRAISGGEPLTAALAGQLLAAGCQLFNAYGPTETTIWSTVAEITTVTEPVTIGRPIANTVVEILDERGCPCPSGIAGELCIGGTGLAAGYLGQPELTSARFSGDGPDRRYRTGDRGRWRADGTIVLHGRSDRQVKLRGHRLELGEVEAVLERHPSVRAAAACLVPGPQDHEILAAFVQPAGSSGENADLAEPLWRYLSERLPAYEVPSRFIMVPGFPLTRNGKVDHRRLAGQMTSRAADADLPEDPLLHALVEMWRELLGSPALDANSNFFLNGGDSLVATQLMGMVRSRLGQEIDFATVFARPTPLQIAEQLRTREPA